MWKLVGVKKLSGVGGWSGGGLYWAQTFWTWSVPSLCIFSALRVYSTIILNFLYKEKYIKKVHKFIPSHAFVGFWYDGHTMIWWSSYDKNDRPEYSIWYMQAAILVTYCFCNSWSIHVDSISYSSCKEEQAGQLVFVAILGCSYTQGCFIIFCFLPGMVRGERTWYISWASSN